MAKVDIFSGFLGAGKTTLIRKLIAEAYDDEKIVLIENEFGEIGIDSGFLKETGIQINEMNSGCICCTLVGDFGRALNEVIETYDPDRILIEPSGVGKLSDVIIAVQNLNNGKIRLNGFTTVVDAKKCKIYMANFGEFYKNQVEHASSIILSHTDGLSQAKLDQCIALIREHNAHAAIVTTPWDQLTGGSILETMERKKTLSAELDKLRGEALTREREHEHEHHHHGQEHGSHHEHEHHHHKHEHHHHAQEHDHHDDHGHHHADDVFDEFGIYTTHRFTAEQISEALGKLSNFAEYGQVLRAKGIVEGENGKWLHFDYVPGEPEVREGTAETSGMLCVIGVGLDREAISELFGI